MTYVRPRSGRWRYLLLLVFTGHALAGAEAGTKGRAPGDRERATRLQVFLDRANFAPGKVDGRCGEFTWKAFALWRQANGLPPLPPAPSGAGEALPDTRGLDLAGVEPVFVQYTVTADDVRSVGTLPADRQEQALLKNLPYTDLTEAIAEKFHSDPKFLLELNPQLKGPWKEGDIVLVPNVEPFDLAAWNRPTSATPPPRTGVVTTVRVDTVSSMAEVYENDRLVAAYPVTVGSERTVSPLGDWKVKGVARKPDFRYDEAMLERGERSEEFVLLPPGPNNPVGVCWIALNKPGIGLHGTNDPDRIGRSASHGCIRLSNWDVARLAARVRPGVSVAIH